MLSNSIQVLQEVPQQDEMFVIGDVKVVPNLSGTCPPGKPLGLYFQIYNAAVDQTTQDPSLRVGYKLFRDDRLLMQTADDRGQSIQYSSEQRVVVVKLLSVAGLEPGSYQIRVDVEDLISGQKLDLAQDFTVPSTASQQASLN